MSHKIIQEGRSTGGESMVCECGWQVTNVLDAMAAWKDHVFNEHQGKEIQRNVSFGQAVEIMRRGGCVTRTGWRDHELKWLFKKQMRPSEGLWHAFIVMKTKDGRMIPWLASPVDIFATDWIEVRP